MKSNHVLKAIALAIACTIIPLCANLNAQTAKPTKTPVSKKYSCAHHPDKISDKPGKCACGMEMVEVKETSKMAEEAKPTVKQDSKTMMKKSSKSMKSKKDMMTKPSTTMKKDSPKMKEKM